MARPSLTAAPMRRLLEPLDLDSFDDSEETGVGLRPGADQEEGGPSGRVPSWRLKALIDRIQELLGLSERQVIHRYLAVQVGVSTRSVLRYDKGDVATAPGCLIDAARAIVEQVRMGRPVVFLRGRAMRPVVVRKQLTDLVDRVIRGGLFDDRFDLFRRVEEFLGLKPGRVARLYRSTDVQLVDKALHDAVTELASRGRYDPRDTYEVGDRIRHPVFGLGVVAAKEPKDKILVRFNDGSEQVFREKLTEDPIRRRLWGQFDHGEAHVLALSHR